MSVETTVVEKASVEEVVRDVLGSFYAGDEIDRKHMRIDWFVDVLNVPSLSRVATEGAVSDAYALMHEELRRRYPDDGIAATFSLCCLFSALDREHELGWILGELYRRPVPAMEQYQELLDKYLKR